MIYRIRVVSEEPRRHLVEFIYRSALGLWKDALFQVGDTFFVVDDSNADPKLDAVLVVTACRSGLTPSELVARLQGQGGVSHLVC